MIDFRYHIVSLVAVFLALGLGIVVGTTQLKGAVVGDLHSQIKDLKSEKQTLQQRNETLQGQVSNDGKFADSVGPAVVDGRLRGDRVLVVVAPGTADGLVTAMSKQLHAAGATVTTELQLNDGYTDPRRAADLKQYVTSSLPAGFRLPTTDDAGTLAGSLLADVLAARPGQDQPTRSQRQQVLAGFGTLHVLQSPDGDVTPADYAVLVSSGTTPGENPQSGAHMVAALAAGLQGRTKGVLVAGNAAAAGTDAPLGVIRSDDALAAKVSTVDNADTTTGRVVSVLGLDQLGAGRKAGQFGTADNAGSPLPATS